MNRGIFGGGVFSVARSKNVRIVGKGKHSINEIEIQPIRGAKRNKKGEIEYPSVPPFLPRSFREAMHPGGNSVCFAIQAAHLMQCHPIYLVGFTLQRGSNYFFSRTNPVTKKATIYQTERALAFCRWYESKFPGRVLLDPSFDGPIYSVFKKAKFDERQGTTG